MSFVQPHKNAFGSGVGVGVAVVFHVALLWALMNGLGHKLVQAISAPLEARIVEETKEPPPPPKIVEASPPPRFTSPPPAYIPPPEVHVQAAPVPPMITAPAAEPPIAAPDAQRAEQAPAPAPAVAAVAAPVSASVVCSNYGQVMGDAGFPREAQRAGLDEGNALIQFTLGVNGEVKAIEVLRASHPAFAKGAARIVAEFKCAGQGRDVNVRVPFVFKSG